MVNELVLKWNITATSINAVTSTIVSVVVYNALRPALRKAGFLPVIGKNTETVESDTKNTAA